MVEITRGTTSASALKLKLASLLWLLCAASSFGQTFVLPTPNEALLKGAPEKYFVGTVGRTWESGTFGCVRSEGFQMHEGLDIKAVNRDSKGEPADPIFAAAPGKVAYINSKSGLSNFGRYVVLQHKIEGIDVYTTYAHLKDFEPGIKVGAAVKSGQKIATMGRTTNTRQAISKERGHLHFEINLKLSDRFIPWQKKRYPGQRNDHGEWNGKNFLGLDPRLALIQQNQQGKDFSLLSFIRNQPELCRVIVRDSNFGWLRRYTPLVLRNRAAEKAGVAGYEVFLNNNGVPYKLIPRSADEISGRAHLEVISVNAAEQQANPCRKLVAKAGGKWVLGKGGKEALDLLLY
ncbi:MAG: M23 family metallopeptidase [Verrucomicrobiales bacterium]